MRGSILGVGMVLLALTVSARADDPIKPEQLKKAYDDALVQLRAAQDRKAELAKDNEALAARIEELKKQLAASQAQVDTLKHEVDATAERTFFLRSYQAAWKSFIRRYPEVMVRWKIYLNDSILSVPQEAPDMFCPEWPPLDG